MADAVPLRPLRPIAADGSDLDTVVNHLRFVAQHVRDVETHQRVSIAPKLQRLEEQLAELGRTQNDDRRDVHARLARIELLLEQLVANRL